MSGSTGWGARNRYRPAPGVEMASDDTLYDVVAWRTAMQTALEGEIQTITKEHYQSHQGNAFMVHYNSSSLNAGQTINVYMKTPSTPHINLIYNVTGSGAFDFEILEAPTVTANSGNHGVSVFNKYRPSATTSTVQDNATSPASNKISTDVTVSADGTIIKKEVYGANKGGGEYSLFREVVLKATTAYVFRLTSQSAGNRVHINLDWYEST